MQLTNKLGGKIMITRGRRLRINKEMIDLVRENILTANDFIFPIFVVEGNNI